MAKKKQVAAPKVEAPVVAQNDVEELIAAHHKIDDWIKAQTKAFAEHVKPHKARLEEIENQLLALSNAQKCNSFKTDAGTAYRSTLMNLSISPEGSSYTNSDGNVVIGREALLDFALENWNEIGNDLLLISAQKDAVKRYMEDHAGAPPPGIKVGFFTRINVNRS